MVRVYAFEAFDIFRDEMVVAEAKATLEAIKRSKHLVVVAGSEEEVDEAALDGDGLYLLRK